MRSSKASKRNSNQATRDANSVKASVLCVHTGVYVLEFSSLCEMDEVLCPITLGKNGSRLRLRRSGGRGPWSGGHCDWRILDEDAGRECEGSDSPQPSGNCHSPQFLSLVSSPNPIHATTSTTHAETSFCHQLLGIQIFALPASISFHIIIFY